MSKITIKDIIKALIFAGLVSAGLFACRVILQNSMQGSRTAFEKAEKSSNFVAGFFEQVQPTATDYDIGYTLTPLEQHNVSMAKIMPLNAIAEVKPVEPVLTEEEYRMISITAVNADFTDNDSLLCVIRVIYNRLHSDKFKPTTVEGILTQKGQFESCDRVAGYAREAYDYEHIKELIDLVFTYDYSPFGNENVLFYASDKISKNKIAKGLSLVCHEGGTNFYSQE